MSQSNERWLYVTNGVDPVQVILGMLPIEGTQVVTDGIHPAWTRKVTLLQPGVWSVTTTNRHDCLPITRFVIDPSTLTPGRQILITTTTRNRP